MPAQVLALPSASREPNVGARMVAAVFRVRAVDLAAWMILPTYVPGEAPEVTAATSVVAELPFCLDEGDRRRTFSPEVFAAGTQVRCEDGSVWVVLRVKRAPVQAECPVAGRAAAVCPMCFVQPGALHEMIFLGEQWREVVWCRLWRTPLGLWEDGKFLPRGGSLSSAALRANLECSRRDLRLSHGGGNRFGRRVKKRWPPNQLNSFARWFERAGRP
jgi:hypothetical protein